MRIPHHWARESAEATGPDNRRYRITSVRSSDVSPEDARRAAQAAARTAVERVARGETLDSYLYADRPLREVVIQEIGPSAGDGPANVITRNAYGALVLNSARVMFVDVDVPRPPRFSFFKRLMGQTPEDPYARYLEHFRAWVEGHPGARVRVYRTFKGYRLLLCHQLFDPSDPASDAIMEQLGADTLYRRLCRIQECFRARLSPKPWRLGLPAPTGRYPFANEEVRRSHESWVERYETASSERATCELVECLGSGRVDRVAEAIADVHDRHCRVGSGAGLA